jgi:hypothetical protein
MTWGAKGLASRVAAGCAKGKQLLQSGQNTHCALTPARLARLSGPPYPELRWPRHGLHRGSLAAPPDGAASRTLGVPLHTGHWCVRFRRRRCAAAAECLLREWPRAPASFRPILLTQILTCCCRIACVLVAWPFAQDLPLTRVVFSVPLAAVEDVKTLVSFVGGPSHLAVTLAAQLLAKTAIVGGIAGAIAWHDVDPAAALGLSRASRAKANNPRPGAQPNHNHNQTKPATTGRL